MASPDRAPGFDVFLSYHSGDAGWVAGLRSALESKGIAVWLDSEQIRPGDLFPRVLARAVGSVRSVVIVLSPGAVASAWVEEEYTLALAQRCHVVPVLIDSVEPPGFLAGRTWVDFRDADQFAASVDRLVFGITGRRPPEGAAAPVPEYREAAPVAGGTDEAQVLERLIARRRRDARRLWLARAISLGAGAAIGAAFFAAGTGADPGMRLGVSLVAAVILALAGWAATATNLARLSRRLEQFQMLRDGLEACRARSHPGCTKLRQHFWDMMVRNATEAGLDVRHV